MNQFNEQTIKKAIKESDNTLNSLKSEQSRENIKQELSLDPPRVAETLENKGELVFLTESGEVVKSIKAGNIEYLPPEIEQCDYLLPHLENTLNLVSNWTDQTTIQLYEELVSYHRQISDLPINEYYDFFALWDLHTWLIEKCHYSPFIYLFAVRERGKSRTMKGLIYLARRGIYTETIREPDILRWGENHKASIGFDIKDLSKKLFRQNCEDLLLSRYERGVKASRTLHPEKGPFRDTKSFDLFGPTVMSSNRPIDDILESRTISIEMKPSTRQFNQPVKPENTQNLKNKLAAFRIYHHHTPLIQANKPASGRLGDILRPLHRIMLTFYPQKEEIFKQLVKIIENQRKNNITSSPEAQVLIALQNVKNETVNGKLSVSVITEKINKNLSEREKRSNRSISGILRSLGFTGTRMTEGYGGIIYDPNLLQTLTQQYGVNEESEASEGSEDKNSHETREPTSEQVLDIFNEKPST